MTDTIWVALISLVSSIAVAMVSYRANRKGAEAASKANAELIAYRLQELEKKVDKHNQIVERTYLVEGRITEAEHDIRDLKARVG